jgi:hypothetical protein
VSLWEQQNSQAAGSSVLLPYPVILSRIGQSYRVLQLQFFVSKSVLDCIFVPLMKVGVRHLLILASTADQRINESPNWNLPSNKASAMNFFQLPGAG